MSRFDLRDVSVRLTQSRDTKAVVFEFLRSLEGARSDWRASLAFYEVGSDAFVDVFEIEGGRLIRREIVVGSKELPDRLVRKLFDASAIFNAREKPALFSGGLGTAPCYVAEERDASELMPLTALSEWRSCICLPLGDQSDLMGILVLTSAKKSAFGGRALSEILPVKSLVTVALAKHLHRAVHVVPAVAPAAPPPPPTFAPTTADAPAREAESDLREQLETLSARSRELEQEEHAHGEMMANLTRDREDLQRSSEEYRNELERVKAMMAALEAQAAAATEHLSAAYDEMNDATWEASDLERRVTFTRKFLQMLCQEVDEPRLPMTVVAWLSGELNIERCSLMTLDATGEVLEISAQCGLDAGVAANVRVRVGQGVAGWVAHNRKPLLVRMRSEAEITPEHQAETYNSPSFIAVPVVHSSRLYGVLNLSNKLGGELFDGVDFDCASLAGAALAVRLAGCVAAGNDTAHAA